MSTVRGTLGPRPFALKTKGGSRREDEYKTKVPEEFGSLRPGKHPVGPSTVLEGSVLCLNFVLKSGDFVRVVEGHCNQSKDVLLTANTLTGAKGRLGLTIKRSTGPTGPRPSSRHQTFRLQLKSHKFTL